MPVVSSIDPFKHQTPLRSDRVICVDAIIPRLVLNVANFQVVYEMSYQQTRFQSP